MGNRIISISRQFGSGGHEVAVKTTDHLAIRNYERQRRAFGKNALPLG